MIETWPPSSRIAALGALALIAGATAACQTGPETSGLAQGVSAEAQPGPPVFVEAACGDCHSVEPAFLSPNPDAPSFASIANREGLTDATLSTWLTDAHNYPEVMDFSLTADQIDVIANYMITLRRDDFVPEQ